MNGPVRLHPSPRNKVWGKRRLQPWFPDSAEPVGEVWFEADRHLSLLVKLIFTSEPLSVQLHPDDGEAGLCGKTEMWHILEAEPGARIAAGFREPVTRERLRESLRTGEIVDLLKWHPVEAGQTYWIPAHTVHAIGAGVVLCEIQQNSDVTYRLWDYGRGRELHLERGLPLADLGVHPGPVPAGSGQGCQQLVCCRHFETRLLRVPGGRSAVLPPDRCHLLFCLEGSGQIGGRPFHRGECWLLPESLTEVHAVSDGSFLETFVPAE